MNSILLPHVIEQQAKLERQIAKERKAELPKTTEDFVIEWLIKSIPIMMDDDHEYTCVSYTDFCDYIYRQLNLPLWAEDFFNIDEFIWKEYMVSQDNGGGAFYLVYKDDEGFVLAENIGDIHSVWKDKPRTFFLKHPVKKDFYIVRCAP